MSKYVFRMGIGKKASLFHHEGYVVYDYGMFSKYFRRGLGY